MTMTHEEFERWEAGFDFRADGQSERIAIPRQKFLEEFNLSEEEALEIIGVFEKKGSSALEDADFSWYCYYWDSYKMLELEEKVSDLEDEIHNKNNTLFRLKANFLETLNNIYHSDSIDEAREYIDKELDIN